MVYRSVAISHSIFFDSILLDKISYWLSLPLWDPNRVFILWIRIAIDEFVYPGILGTVLPVIGIPFMVHSCTVLKQQVSKFQQHVDNASDSNLPKLSFQKASFLISFVPRP